MTCSSSPGEGDPLAAVDRLVAGAVEVLAEHGEGAAAVEVDDVVVDRAEVDDRADRPADADRPGTPRAERRPSPVGC